MIQSSCNNGCSFTCHNRTSSYTHAQVQCCLFSHLFANQQHIIPFVSKKIPTICISTNTQLIKFTNCLIQFSHTVALTTSSQSNYREIPSLLLSLLLDSGALLLFPDSTPSSASIFSSISAMCCFDFHTIISLVCCLYLIDSVEICYVVYLLLDFLLQ